ncbi:MAG: phenylalanine--tRNA ligase subunit beta [Thermodesulfobacteriota bacterium]|nr:phenylalanine--tRNA ligase subunit beta [Thermodesulfobacteriota bacterium]
MLVSLRWLRDYIDVDVSPDEIARLLTMTGLEVDSVEEWNPGFSGVVVSRVLSVKPHPNSDKLLLCEVTTGEETLPIVCGAPNVSEGIFVPLAKVGAEIPGGYTIKRSKLRGEPSEGMLCSEEELGIGEDASGIMILPDMLSLGEDLASALDLKDVIFDVAITPNRSDCLSIIGIAREIAALTGKKLKYPEIKFVETEEDVNAVTSVEILDPHLCPRYTARIIKNVKVKTSPSWMRLRLEAVGLRAINNIVDVTNFVMMEFGQPLHAFDFRYLEEGRIRVRGASEGEEFVSLDEKTRILNSDTLMICDGVKPVAVAGIMGGLNSEVVDDTETVLLESAYFNPSSIRKSSRNLGMSTDAAFRFERGIDPEGVIRASDRAAQLMANLSGGTICSGCIDQYPRKIKPVKDIPLRVKRVGEIIGTGVEKKKILSILESLEMTAREDGDGKYLVTPPTFRVDIEREIDLVEEISRILGYEHIPDTLPAVSGGSEMRNKKSSLEPKVREILNGSGYTEVINYSFTTPESANILGLEKNDEGRRFVVLRDPLSEDISVMRTGHVFGLLDTMRKNVNLGNPDLRLFEIGKIFIGNKAGELPDERERLGGLITGSRHEEAWHTGEEKADFYDLKGCLDNLFSELKIYDISYNSNCEIPFLHPGRSCTVKTGDKTLGFLGEIHPQVRTNMDLKDRAVVFELDFSCLVELFSEAMKYSEIPRFPSTSRDVAFLVDGEIESGDMISMVLDTEEELLENVRVFDVYMGKGISAGMKSLAIRFTYRSPLKTLTDSEVNETHARIVKKIVKLTKAKIRGSEV